MSQTVELPRLGGPGSGLGGPWRVVVLNDDYNTFDHVAETLARFIPGVSLADGYRLADRIHNTRRAVVWSGPPGGGGGARGRSVRGASGLGPAPSGPSGRGSRGPSSRASCAG